MIFRKNGMRSTMRKIRPVMCATAITDRIILHIIPTWKITGWGIRVTENLSAQKQTGRTYGVLIALGLSALIIGVFCTQYFMTKKIFAPITHILQVFAQIRESEDYSLRVHIQEKHETGELAAGINELLDYVEQADRKEKERQQKLLQMAENDPLTGIQK